MTNFIQSQIRFTLHSEGTESYSWAWQGIDRAQALKDIADDGNDIVAYAHGWAEELCSSAVDQINPEGERGFSAEEITNDLIDDRHFLAAALQAWLSEGDEPEDDDDQEPEGDDDQEPELLYEITHEIMGEWDAPATVDEIGQAVAQWHTRGANYTVKVDLGRVYIYVELDEVNHGTDEDDDMWATDSDFLPSNDNWIDLDGQRTSYRLEIGELYQPEGDDDQDPEDDQVPGQGLLLCTSSLGGRGITPASPIYIFSGEKDFRNQNPQWHGVELPDPRWHGVTIIDIDLPVQGGYQAEWGGNPTRKSDGYTYYPY